MSKERNEVFNNAIFVLDSVNCSRLSLLPSLLICTVGLINWFKCRFWTWKVASFFCWGTSPSRPSCGLTLNSSSAAPRELEGAGGAAFQNQGGFKGGPREPRPTTPWISPLLIQHWRKHFRRGDSPCLQGPETDQTSLVPFSSACFTL